FRNMIQAFLVVKQGEGAQAFLDTYTSFLPKHFRSDCEKIAQASIWFWQQKYQEVIQHLNGAKSPQTNFILQVDLYRLQIKSWLELGDQYQLDMYLRRFDQYLKDKKHPETKREALKAFTKACRMLMSPNAFTPHKKRQFLQEVLPNAPISDQIWLRQQWEKRGEATE
ncbi:MAG: hypothetical protein AAF399_22990, partial [Bacteroidota bacterium]